jgi:hypothetical protein
MTCYNSELPIGPPGPQGPPGIPGEPAALPYKVYTALLTQTGTDAPVAIELENTLGGPVTYSRTEAGSYEIISDNLFGNSDKCIVFLGSNKIPAFLGGIDTRVITRYGLPSSILLYSLDINLSDFVEAFNSIFNLAIEIRVYP